MRTTATEDNPPVSHIERMWHDRTLLGSKVRRGKQTATVWAILDDWSPGAVMLDQPIQGFQYWNVDELKLASNPKT